MSSSTSTHIAAYKNQIAPRVLMPGDPGRAKWMAKTYLKNAKLVSDVRGMTAYTGTYKNVPVTIFPHGMGIPSVCIYAHELFTFYNVEVIYRVGSCGVTNNAHLFIGDVVLATSCWSDVPTDHWSAVKPPKPNTFYPTASCNELIRKTANHLGIVLNEQPVFSATFFYSKATLPQLKKITKTNISEMEGFGLFLEAAVHHKKAACLLTVSDNMETGEKLNSKARATTFDDMALLALESIIKEKI